MIEEERLKGRKNEIELEKERQIRRVIEKEKGIRDEGKIGEIMREAEGKKKREEEKTQQIIKMQEKVVLKETKTNIEVKAPVI